MKRNQFSFLYVVIGGLILLDLSLRFIQFNHQSGSIINQSSSNTFDELSKRDEFFKRNRLLLAKVQRHLATAHRYSRSSVTMNEIGQAFSLLSRVMLNEEKEELIQQTSHVNSSSKSQRNLDEICPEQILHKESDHPLYTTHLETDDCTNGKPLGKEVVGFAVMTANCSTARAIIDGISTRYTGMRAALGIESSENCNIQDSQSKKFKSLDISTGLSQTGANWKALINKLHTKYVLVSRNLYTFDDQSSLERLVRIISESGIDAVGGAQRFEDGRWMSGCYQMAMRNYTLRLLEGYDLSYKSCMYCDYLSTAFLSPSSVLLNKLDDKMVGNAVFVDFFTRLFQPHKIGAMMCVDVMFSSDYHDINDRSKSQWQQIAIKYRLNRIVLPNSQDVQFDCEESKIDCSKNKGEVVPPCCLKELSDTFLTMMKVCEEKRQNCTIISSNVAGALKLYAFSSWEREIYIDFHFNNYEAFVTALRKQNCSVEYNLHNRNKQYYDICWANDLYCYYFKLKTKNWIIEMYGGNTTVFDKRGNYRVPTKILLSGMWMNTHTNPGMLGRKMYGDNLLKHAEDFGVMGQSKSWSYYSKTESESWSKCAVPNFHGCLSNWLPTGNIQFKDFWL